MNFSSLYQTATSLSLIKKKNDEHLRKTAAVHSEIDDCEEISSATLAGTAIQVVLLVVYAVIAYYKKKCRGRPSTVADGSRTDQPGPELSLERLNERTADPVMDGADYHRLLSMTSTALYIRDGVIHVKKRGNEQDAPAGKIISN